MDIILFINDYFLWRTYVYLMDRCSVMIILITNTPQKDQVCNLLLSLFLSNIV